jgi:hypothetical protein
LSKSTKASSTNRSNNILHAIKFKVKKLKNFSKYTQNAKPQKALKGGQISDEILQTKNSKSLSTQTTTSRDRFYPTCHLNCLQNTSSCDCSHPFGDRKPGPPNSTSTPNPLNFTKLSKYFPPLSAIPERIPSPQQPKPYSHATFPNLYLFATKAHA